MRFSIRNKLLAGFGAVIAVLAILGVMALSQMGSINAGATSFNDDVVPSITVVDTASQDAEAVRSTQYQHVLAPDEATMNALQQRLAADTATVDGAVKRYRADMVSDAHDRAMIDAVAGAWRAYESATARVVTLSRTGHDQQATAILNGAAPAYQRLETALQRLVAGNRAAGQQVHRDSNSTFATAKTLTITLILLALAIGAAVAFALSRSISRGIGQMLRAARGLAEGDIEQDVQVSSRDEIGDMAAAFEATIAYNREMAATARHIAEGDLTVAVEPKSDRDALGHAFATMIGNLRGLIGEVAAGADTLGSASQQMASTREAFEAIGAAVHDMTTRVGEIAAAVGQISSEAERAESDVAEVAGVAEESSASAEQVSASTQQTSASTQEITASAQSLAQTAEQLKEVVRRFRLTA